MPLLDGYRCQVFKDEQFLLIRREMIIKFIFDKSMYWLKKGYHFMGSKPRQLTWKQTFKEALVVGVAIYLIGIVLAILNMNTAHAAERNAEAVGPTYPITEPDMLEEMQNKLKAMEQSGRLKVLQAEAIKRSQGHIEAPIPVIGLTRTKKAHVFYYDPSYVVPSAINAPNGQIIGQAGQRINPLDYVVMSKHLVFFDGNDPEQVNMAVNLMKRYEGRVKPILTSGKPLELTRTWKQQVYFDQGGSLVKRFGIKQVPALVSQDNKRLRIDELEVK